MNTALTAKTKFDAEQIEAILDKLVPIIAAPKDQGFFRGILRIKAEASTSGEFSAFVSRLLTEARAVRLELKAR